MRRQFLFFSILSLLLASCGPKEELRSYSTQAASDSTPSRWPSGKFPIKLSLDSSFEQDEKNALKDMAHQWSDSTKAVTQYFETYEPADLKQYNKLDNYEDSVMGIYKVKKWDPELPASALAVTQIFGTHHGSYIKIDHADILINYENFDFSTDGGYGYDLSTVILHEMGHFLGLYHEYDKPDESIMYPSISRFDVIREPFEYDIYIIQNKYRSNAIPADARMGLNSESNSSENKRVIIRLELNAQGKCFHRINGKVVHEH